jgi:hypothetical protein
MHVEMTGFLSALETQQLENIKADELIGKRRGRK